jgi:aerobic-type carbon monoxide dehydrogenase small subunit (CoxS/CutS family)
VTVAFEIDGSKHCFATWSDMSALYAVRYLAKHDRPRRGCEMGQCGACESTVNGAPTRLCQLPSTSLDGCVITTRPGSVDPVGPLSSSGGSREGDYVNGCAVVVGATGSIGLRSPSA